MRRLRRATDAIENAIPTGVRPRLDGIRRSLMSRCAWLLTSVGTMPRTMASRQRLMLPLGARHIQTECVTQTAASVSGARELP
jgi:hypothetical protein